MRQKNQDLLLEIAWLYYIRGLTQGEIAGKVNLSRPTVIKLLQQAREEGIVEIRLTRPLPRVLSLAERLEERFAGNALYRVVVTATGKEAVGRAAADYLSRAIKRDTLLGVGWSTTLKCIPRFFAPGKQAPGAIVQLVGAVGAMAGANAYEIAMELGRLLGVPVEHLPAPAIVESVALRRALLRDPAIARTLELARQSDIGLVGVGIASPASTMVQTGYLSAADMEAAAERGAVGDILSHYFDIAGKPVETPWEDRIVGLSLSALRHIENVVAVAAGSEKAAAVVGAVRSDVVNTLVVDEPLAEAILGITTNASARGHG